MRQSDLAGVAALAICESLLLALKEHKVLDEESTLTTGYWHWAYEK